MSSSKTLSKNNAKNGSWSAARTQLRSWSHSGLLGLIKDLYTGHAEVRAAISARLLADQPIESRHAALAPLRKQVTALIRKRDWSKPDFRAARKVINDYCRMSDDADGALDLSMAIITAAMSLAFDYGWHDSQFYDSLWRVTQHTTRLIPRTRDASVLKQAIEQITSMLTHDNFPGWGMDDALTELQKALIEHQDSLARQSPTRKSPPPMF